MRFAVYSSLLVGILAAGCAPAAPERTAPAANRAADEQALRDRIVPELGARKLGDITRRDVLDLVDRLLGAGLDPSTFLKRQALWVAVGVAVMIAVALVDYR